MAEVLLADDAGRIVLQPDGSGIPAFDDTPAGLLPRVAVHSADDFASALMDLLPRGRAWPRDPDSVLAQVVSALGPLFARLEQRAADMLVDAFPASTFYLLPEWEAATGLPDPCGNGFLTIAQRRQAVVARLTLPGGQSVPYIVALAAALGYAVEVQEFRPSFCDDALGLPLGGEEWAGRWRVVVAPQSADAWDAVNHRWFVTVLECAIRRMAPAHMELAFIYRAAGLGPFILGRDVLAPAS